MFAFTLLTQVSAYHERDVNLTNIFHCNQHEIYNGPSTCYSFGDPHILSFDGVSIDFQGYGEYYLVYPQVPQDLSVVVMQTECNRTFQSNSKSVDFSYTCNRGFSVGKQGVYVAAIFDEVAISIDIKIYQSGVWSSYSGPQTILGFGSVALVSLENKGFQVTLSMSSGEIIRMSWFQSAAGVIEIYSPAPLLSSGLCGFYDGCYANDLVVRSSPQYWWDWTLESVVNSKVFIAAAQELEGYGRVYAGGLLPAGQPLLPLNSSNADIRKYFASTWKLSLDEAQMFFGSATTEEYYPLSSKLPSPSTKALGCFANFFLPGVSAPPSLLRSCIHDVSAANDISAAWGSHYVLLRVCDNLCSTGSFLNPSPEFLANHCEAFCKVGNLELHQDYKSNVPAGLYVEQNAVFHPQGLGGRYVIQFQAQDQCESTTSQVNVDVVCPSLAVAVSAGAPKYLKKSWYGAPVVFMNGNVNLASSAQLSWTFTRWPGQNSVPAVASPVLTRGQSLFPWWQPLYAGLYELELGVYDGCVIGRSRVNVTVDCPPPPTVTIRGARSLIWSVGAVNQFPTLALTADVQQQGSPVTIPLFWALVFKTSTVNGTSVFSELALGSTFNFASDKVLEFTSQTASSKTYTIYQYLSTSNWVPQVVQQNQSSVTNNTESSVSVTDTRSKSDSWGRTTQRTLKFELNTTSSVRQDATSTLTLEAVRRPACIVNLQLTGGTSGATLSWTVVGGTVGGCEGLYRIQAATAAAANTVDQCTQVQDEVVVELSCGPNPVLVVDPNTSLNFNYKLNTFPTTTVAIDTAYDPLQRTSTLVTSASLSQIPAGAPTPTFSLVTNGLSFRPTGAGTYVVALGASNNCGSSTKLVSVAVSCPETLTLLLNFSSLYYDYNASGLLYDQNPIQINIDGSMHGADPTNPLPPITWSISRTQPLPAALTKEIPVIGVIAGGPSIFEFQALITGDYDITATMSNGCGQTVSKTSRVQLINPFSMNLDCDFPLAKRTQVVSFPVNGTMYDHFELSSVFTVLGQSWKLTSKPARSALGTTVPGDFTPDVDGTYIVDLVGSDNNLGWCTNRITLTATPCTAPDVVISNSTATSYSLNRGDTFTLFFDEVEGITEPIVVWYWTSSANLGIRNVTTQVITFSTAGTFTVTLSFGTTCSTASKTITFNVACPAIRAVAQFTDNQGNVLQSANSLWTSDAFSRVYFNGAASNLLQFTWTDLTNSQWRVLSAPATSLYAPNTSSATSSTKNTTILSTPIGGGLENSRNNTLVTTTTQTQVFTVVLLSTGRFGAWTAYIDPDVAGTYTVQLTVTGPCGASTSTLTFTASCSTPPTTNFVAKPLSPTMVGPTPPLGTYVAQPATWLDASNLGAGTIGVATFSGAVSGRVVFRQLGTNANEIYVQLQDTAGTPVARNFSWVLQNDTTECTASALLYTLNGKLSNSASYQKDCQKDKAACATGDLGKRFGVLSLSNSTWTTALFQDSALRIPPSALYNKVIGHNVAILLNGSVYACAPVTTSPIYRVSLSRVFPRRLLLDASNSQGSSSLNFRWTWSFSGRVGTQLVPNVLDAHSNDALALALGSTLDQPLNSISNFVFLAVGVYTFRYEVTDGCSTVATTFFIDAVCENQRVPFPLTSVPLSLSVNADKGLTTSTMTFVLATNVSAYLEAQPAQVGLSVAGYLTPQQLALLTRKSAGVRASPTSLLVVLTVILAYLQLV